MTMNTRPEIQTRVKPRRVDRL
ncbi:hypothetical protein STRTUCAR8_09807, partial [Streptomyces turgidiscabies Car8]